MASCRPTWALRSKACGFHISTGCVTQSRNTAAQRGPDPVMRDTHTEREKQWEGGREKKVERCDGNLYVYNVFGCINYSRCTLQNFTAHCVLLSPRRLQVAHMQIDRDRQMKLHPSERPPHVPVECPMSQSSAAGQTDTQTGRPFRVTTADEVPTKQTSRYCCVDRLYLASL